MCGIVGYVGTEACAPILLDGLSVQDLIDLGVATDHALTAPSARRLQEHTGGLPLHVVALLEELDPAALQRVSGPLPAPRSLSAVILARVAGASRDTELLLAAAAVLGERTSVVHASAVAGLDDPLAALDEAVSLGLLFWEVRHWPAHAIEQHRPELGSLTPRALR